MSHFSVLVIGKDAEAQLAMYDEGLELPLHIVATREQLINSKRNWIESYRRNTYAEYLSDPEMFKAKYSSNQNFVNFVSEVFPQMLNWTDEECYEDEVRDYREYIEEGASWCKIDRKGNLWKTSNENAKWDWYCIGGRFRGRLRLKEGAKPIFKSKYENYPENCCDIAYKKDIANWLEDDFGFYAVVIGGEWYERGRMGWWGIGSDEKDIDDWKAEIREILADVEEDDVVSVYDCHI